MQGYVRIAIATYRQAKEAVVEHPYCYSVERALTHKNSNDHYAQGW
ncbi:hypothetical protein [Stenomitos frigidus]|nr:hypothetical protein [Stenomitos frigidus]